VVDGEPDRNSGTSYLINAEQLGSSVKRLFSKVATSPAFEQAIVFGMMFRCIRLFEAVIALLRAGFLEESVFLWRSLFEEGLRLRDLATNPKTRNETLLGWFRSSIRQRKGLFLTAKHIGLDQDIGQQLEAIKMETQQLEERKKQLGITRDRQFLSVKDLAIRHDKKDEYWDYELAHEMVHGSDSAWIFSRQRQSDGTLAFHSRTPDRGLVSAFCAHAAVSLVEAQEATFSILERAPAPAAIRQLLKQIQLQANEDPSAQSDSGKS